MITMPFIVRKLGVERFGLLSLAWVVLSYSQVFDLGLGRAAVKFVAEALARGEKERVGSIVSAAATVQLIIGTVGGLILISLAPFLAETALKLPPELKTEALWTFRLLGLAVPLILLSGSFSGALQGAHRFDLVNAVRIPVSSLVYVAAVLGAFLDLTIPSIIGLSLLVWLGALVAFLVLYTRYIDGFARFSFSVFQQLLSFGGWVTVSSVVAPILVYLERFLLGTLVSVAAVAYYTAPYEAVTRAFWVLPSALSITLFPAFSSFTARGEKEAIARVFARAVKFLVLSVGFGASIVFAFADLILRFWLGPEYAVNGAWAMRLVALGALINSLARVPFVALQGAGRPDLTAKFHLLELPFYVGIAWILVSVAGVAGAATAWALRVALDAGLLFWAALRVHDLSPGFLKENGLLSAVVGVATCGLGLLLVRVFLGTDTINILAILLVGLAFLTVAWMVLLDEADRRIVMNLVSRR